MSFKFRLENEVEEVKPPVAKLVNEKGELCLVIGNSVVVRITRDGELSRTSWLPSALGLSTNNCGQILLKGND